MDRICQYSTIIFAGNVSVLLIVSVVTDYWEYRGFDTAAILPAIRPSNTTELHVPNDTDSYVLIRYYWEQPRRRQQHPWRTLPVSPANTTHYQSPGLVYKYYRQLKGTGRRRHHHHQAPVTETAALNVSRHDLGPGQAAGRLDVTRQGETVKDEEEGTGHGGGGGGVTRTQDIIVLYVQYGNLFRECDNLETGVRARLGLNVVNNGRCFNFITTARPRDGYISRELPAVTALEGLAFGLAVICVVSSVISVTAGGHGSIKRSEHAMLTASASALISGVSLTVAIALFHGKCYLLRRRAFMAGLEVPYKKLINDHRTFTYGWSFVLAGICVVLSFVHSWIWLAKSQDIIAARRTPKARLRRRHSGLYVAWSAASTGGQHDGGTGTDGAQALVEL